MKEPPYRCVHGRKSPCRKCVEAGELTVWRAQQEQVTQDLTAALEAYRKFHLLGFKPRKRVAKRK